MSIKNLVTARKSFFEFLLFVPGCSISPYVCILCVKVDKFHSLTSFISDIRCAEFYEKK